MERVDRRCVVRGLDLVTDCGLPVGGVGVELDYGGERTRLRPGSVRRDQAGGGLVASIFGCFKPVPRKPCAFFKDLYKVRPVRVYPFS